MDTGSTVIKPSLIEASITILNSSLVLIKKTGENFSSRNYKALIPLSNFLSHLN